MKAEINIEEIKNQAVHSELLKAMCLISQARNIVSDTMDEKEIRGHVGNAYKTEEKNFGTLIFTIH